MLTVEEYNIENTETSESTIKEIRASMLMRFYYMIIGIRWKKKN